MRYSSVIGCRSSAGSFVYGRSASRLGSSAAAIFFLRIFSSSRSWTRMPRREALSAYAGPIPRRVVPICSLPSFVSPAVSSSRW